ncbi:MAG: alcohol dehydrogenase catalytic domain-containing protein [Chloroflexi bacterium]|nr:alcohol dehydrogenase catalytic domain-containing protein [Chloroflexota bacterium]
MRVGTVKQIWRYPVKSMGGETVQDCQVGERGLGGDRGWALRDETAGEIRGAKKLPELLECTARYLDAPSGESVPPVEITLPDPQADEVVVKLFASGICHSQLHQLHNPESPTPLLLGHEATGVVIDLGRDVTHVKEGDHVMVTWVPRDITPETARPMRTAFSFRGEDHEGGIYTWAEHVLAKEQLVLPLDPTVPTDVTSIIGCAVVTGVGAVLGTAKVQPGDTVAVYGVGGVGINVVAGAKIANAGRIIAVDLDAVHVDFEHLHGLGNGLMDLLPDRKALPQRLGRIRGVARG